jgi:hypothetical protein
VLLDAIKDLAWAMGTGIVLMFGAIVLVALLISGVVVLVKELVASAHHHKARRDYNFAVQMWQQRMIEARSGRPRIQAGPAVKVEPLPSLENGRQRQYALEAEIVDER